MAIEITASHAAAVAEATRLQQLYSDLMGRYEALLRDCHPAYSAGATSVANPAEACITARDADPARKGDWMQTFTGRRFWPLDPRPEDVCIEDIAHALSLLTRYGGHCTRFYSVAEHCVLLAHAVPEEHRLWALLHDASEAYIADIVRPLKRHLDGYGAAEIRVMASVVQHFALNGVEPPEVKAADSRILMDERAQVMNPTGDTWSYGGAREPLGVTLRFWTPEQAESEFLALYRDLAGSQ